MNKKKLAILTGGKEGLGRELQKELILNGFNIISVDINYKKNRRYISRGKIIIEIKKDVCSKNLVNILNNIIKKNNFEFCIFINNAGIAHQSKFLDLKINKHLQILKVNNHAIIN